MDVQVRSLPAYRVACMHYVGPYGAHGIPELWARLRRWMETRDLAIAATIRLGIGHDDPSVTAPDKCRYDASVVVPADFLADRWVDLVDLPPGRYAVASFAGSAHEIEGAWDQVFSRWLPGSGYQPDDRPCLEVYRGEPGTGGASAAFRCELCLPVRPL